MPTVFESPPQSQPSTVSPAQPQPVAPSTGDAPTTTHSLFHAYCINPDVKFETQHRDERVILFLRAHPITQLPWVITAILFLVAPTFINILLCRFFTLPQSIFFSLLWHTVLFSYIYVNYLNWQFNVGLVTNHRVIDIDYHLVLYKETNASILNKIEDVTVKSGGFFPSFFHYGDIYVQTAGTVPNIEFMRVPNPTQVARVINNLMRRYSAHGHG